MAPLVVDPSRLAEAAVLLSRGEIVAYPTETSYGLGVDASNADAIERLAQLKGRQQKHYFSILVASDEMLSEVVGQISAVAQQLIDAHWPGPLTLILPAAADLPPALANERGGVGVRWSSDPIAQGLVHALGRPITATSANASGAPSATTAKEASLAGVAMVIDDGPRQQAASTIVELLGERPQLLRAGVLDVGL